MENRDQAEDKERGRSRPKRGPSPTTQHQVEKKAHVNTLPNYVCLQYLGVNYLLVQPCDADFFARAATVIGIRVDAMEFPVATDSAETTQMVRIVQTEEQWHNFNDFIVEGMIIHCIVAPSWLVTPAKVFPLRNMPLAELSTKICSALGGRVWTDAASNLLSQHCTALWEFDFLRDGFDRVEHRPMAARTPLLLVCSCGTTVSSRAINSLVKYLAHLASCYPTGIKRWEAWKKNPFITKSELDAIGPSREAKLQETHNCIVRDIPHGFSFDAYWSNFVSTIGFSAPLAQQHSRAQTFQALQAAMHAPRRVPWD